MNEVDIFLEESRELLTEIEETLLQLNQSPDDKELLNKLFRALHTIKGSGSMFGFTKVAEFTHKLENVIDSIRKGEILFSPDLIDPFLAGRDHILRLIESSEDQGGDNGVTEIFTTIDNIVNPKQQEPDKAQKSSPANLKILIVEDEFSSRFILQDFLSLYGDTHIAVDGYEAVTAIKLALAAHKPYDLVCLDIMMPGIDGDKVSEEIRRLESEDGSGKGCRIVMTSSISNRQVIDELVKTGHCDLFLSKPVSINSLGKFIEQSF